MQARPLPPRAAASPWRPPRVASPAALVFLRGRDADARLRELAAARAAARPLLGALAIELVGRRLHEPLGYRSLGDFARERLGVGARAVREWARVWRGLAELPRLRAAVLSGEVSWAVARAVVGLATPDTEAACLETVRGRTLRAVLAIVAVVSEAQSAATRQGVDATDGEEEPEERVAVRLRCTPREAGYWYAAVELARRMAGEELPVWQCAERIAAEAASAVGAPDPDVAGASEAVRRGGARGPDGECDRGALEHRRPSPRSRGDRSSGTCRRSWPGSPGSSPPVVPSRSSVGSSRPLRSSRRSTSRWDAFSARSSSGGSS
jgi:hypothetical protein